MQAAPKGAKPGLGGVRAATGASSSPGSTWEKPRWCSEGVVGQPNPPSPLPDGQLSGARPPFLGPRSYQASAGAQPHLALPSAEILRSESLLCRTHLSETASI